ncbi:MAG: PrsW family glutamic-type intramembrane protease [Blastocatellia bacterium]
MLRLIIQSGSLAERQFQLEQGEASSLLIGRGAESAVRFTEPSVSSRHALIVADGGAFYLLDQNSANGTFLNESRVSEAELRHGDVIGLGRNGPRLLVAIEGQSTMRIDAADTSTLRQDTSVLHQDTSTLHQDTSALRRGASTGRYYAPPTTRLRLRDAARDIGLYNPYFDTGKSKKSPGAGLMWLVFAVLGLMLTGLTIYDVGVGSALAGAISAIIPAGFYLAIFLWLDRYDPEPPGRLIFVFVWGAVIAVFFSAIANGFAASAFGDMLTGIVSAPIVEEATKGVGVLIIALFFRKDFDSVVDGIVYAGVVAMGFATVENIDYYGRSLNEAGVSGLLGTWFVRGVLSPYSHVLFTCMTGIGIGVARETHNAALKVAAPIMGYFIAVFLHALWNSLASFDSGTFFIGYFLIEAPMFCAFLAVIVHLVRREGRILKQSLAVEVERGLITRRQLDIAISVFRRTGWVAAAIGHRGLFNARRQFLRSVAKLGLCHWHKQRAAEAGRDTDSFPLINQLQAEVFSLRDKVGNQ